MALHVYSVVCILCHSVKFSPPGEISCVLPIPSRKQGIFCKKHNQVFTNQVEYLSGESWFKMAILF